MSIYSRRESAFWSIIAFSVLVFLLYVESDLKWIALQTAVTVGWTSLFLVKILWGDSDE